MARPRGGDCCVVEIPLCEWPPQTVFSLSCVPFSVHCRLPHSTPLRTHLSYTSNIEHISQFSYHALIRVFLVTTVRLIAVSLRCLYDGIFPRAEPDLHQKAPLINSSPELSRRSLLVEVWNIGVVSSFRVKAPIALRSSQMIPLKDVR